MSGKVTYKDTGLKALKARLRTLTRADTRVGILGDNAFREHPLRRDLTVGQVGTINEYGSAAAGVPRRSFLKSTAQANHGTVITFMAQAVRAAISGSSSLDAMHRMGEHFVKLVVGRIMSGSTPPPNAPFTVLMKGHDRTLQDTLTLAHSITYDVIERGDKTPMAILADEPDEGDDSGGFEGGFGGGGP